MSSERARVAPIQNIDDLDLDQNALKARRATTTRDSVPSSAILLDREEQMEMFEHDHFKEHANHGKQDDGLSPACAGDEELNEDQKEFLRAQMKRRQQWKEGNARRSQASLNRKRSREIERREQMNRGLEELAELCYKLDPSLYSGKDVPDPNALTVEEPELLKNRGQLLKRAVKVLSELHNENHTLDQKITDLSKKMGIEVKLGRFEGTTELFRTDEFEMKRQEQASTLTGIEAFQDASLSVTIPCPPPPFYPPAMRSSQVVPSVHGASALSSPIIHSEMLLRGREPRLSRLPSQQTILPGLGQPSLLGQHSHVASLSELINRQRILIQYQATSVGTPPSTSILLAHQNLLTQAFALGQTSAVLGTVTGNRPLSNTDESTRGFEGNAVFAKSRSGVEQQASAPHRSIGRSLGASADAISQAASPNVASLARSLSAGNCSTDDSEFLLAALTCRRQPLACSIGEATKRKNGVKPTRETPKPVLSMETKMISKNGSEQKNIVHR